MHIGVKIEKEEAILVFEGLKKQFKDDDYIYDRAARTSKKIEEILQKYSKVSDYSQKYQEEEVTENDFKIFQSYLNPKTRKVKSPRSQILHLYFEKQLKLMKISQKLSIPYSSVQNVVATFKKYGKIKEKHDPSKTKNFYALSKIKIQI